MFFRGLLNFSLLVVFFRLVDSMQKSLAKYRLAEKYLTVWWAIS